MQNVRETLEEEKSLKERNIMDRSIMEKIKNQKEKQLNELLTSENNEMNDIDRLVRRNKFFKDRREEIRIKALV